MGTVFTIDVRSPGVDADVIDEVVDWLHHVDATFSTYRAESPVRRLAAGELWLSECPTEVAFVLAECDRYRALTDGFFDCRLGGVLDPSGYVKGWAIERASHLLERNGSVNHCVNGGGDVQCAGSPELGRPWSVGVVDPRDRSRVLATVSGSRLAVATSGVAERGLHVVDPHTGHRPAEFLSVTVIGERLSEVDVWATAALAMGAQAPDWLRARGLRALLVRPDGRTVTT
jgi:thiamine biosynthesis lipoprotein